jgi:hypothetical protein
LTTNCSGKITVANARQDFFLEAMQQLTNMNEQLKRQKKLRLFLALNDKFFSSDYELSDSKRRLKERDIKVGISTLKF